MSTATPPTPPTAAAPTAAPPHPLLAPDGPLAGEIRSLPRPRTAGGEKARSQALADLALLARAFSSLPAPAPGGPDGRLAQVLTAHRWAPGHTDAGPLLRLAVAARAGLDDCVERLWDEAFRAYYGDRHALDEALGGLIPGYLRAGARLEAAHQAYRDGTAPTAAADMEAYLDLCAERSARPRHGAATGLPGLDEALGGGLRGLTFLGGDAGCGKTSAAVTVAAAALRADAGLAALFVSLDMPNTALFDRLHCQEGGLSWRQLAALGPADAPLRAANEALMAGVLPRLRVLLPGCLGEGGPFANALLRARDGLAKEAGAERVLVVVDYFQCLPALPGDGEAGRGGAGRWTTTTPASASCARPRAPAAGRRARRATPTW